MRNKFLLLTLAVIGIVSYNSEAKAQKVIVYSEGKSFEYINVDSVAYKISEPGDFASRQWLTLVFNGKEAHIPSFEGEDIKWRVFWGDGNVSAVNSTENHSYSDDGPHTVTIRHSGIKEFTLPLKGIQTVDITNF